MSDISIPFGYCHCGCGQKTQVATRNSTRDGLYKGLPKKYIHGHASYRTDPLYLEEGRGYETPCWIWNRAYNTPGYGQITVEGRVILAHRYIYEVQVGPIPDGAHLHHKCEVRACCRPSHVEPLTPAEHAMTRKSTKLAYEDKALMKTLYAGGDTSYSKLGKQFGVATMTAYHAVNSRKCK